MTQHLTINNNQAPLPAGVNAGAVAIEQERAIVRAAAEIQLQKEKEQ